MAVNSNNLENFCSQNNDEEDDSEFDEILKAKGLCQASERASAKETQPNVDRCPREISSELERKAREDVVLYFREVTLPMPNSASLRWFQDKKKLWPCFVAPNPNERAGAFDLKFNPLRQAVVEFIGIHLPINIRGNVQVVHTSGLLPFTQEHSKRYLQQLEKYAPFRKYVAEKHPTLTAEQQEEFIKHYYLRVEEEYLSIIENSLASREKDRRKRRMESHQQNREEIDCLQKDNEYLSKHSPREVPDSHAQDEPDVTAPSQCRKLRAGDEIQYYPPHLVAASVNQRVAIISKVNSRRSAIALELLDGTLLPPSARVCLIRRLIRGTLVPNKGACFHDVSYYQLDPSYNDKEFASQTKTDLMQTALTEAKISLHEAIRATAVNISPDPLEEKSLGDKRLSIAERKRRRCDGASLASPPRNEKSPGVALKSNSMFDSHNERSDPAQPSLLFKIEIPPRENVEKSYIHAGSGMNRTTIDRVGDVPPNALALRNAKSLREQLHPAIRTPIEQYQNLEVELSKVLKIKEGRRYNVEYVEAMERSLRTAMDLCKTFVVDIAQVRDWARQYNYDEDLLWVYLKGNANNLLSVKKLHVFTAKFSELLNSRSPLGESRE